MIFKNQTIYHELQCQLAYESLRLEEQLVNKEMIEALYEQRITPDDVLSSLVFNHFLGFDYIIYHLDDALTSEMISNLFYLLSNHDAQVKDFAGSRDLDILLKSYEGKKKTVDVLLDFHVRLMNLHPFGVYTGMMARLLLFKECLHFHIMPLIIHHENKFGYVKGMVTWHHDHRPLRELATYEQAKLRLLVRYSRRSEIIPAKVTNVRQYL